MNELKQICAEILDGIKESNIKTQHELNRLKLRVLSKYKSNVQLKQIPKNADIYFAASEKDRN